MKARLRINGQEETVEVATVLDLVSSKGVDVSDLGVAVAVNGSVVPRREWEFTPLEAGDDVEIVTPHPAD